DGRSHYSADDCQVTPVIHVLQYPGCVPKPIPSFACIGRCASYIQVSGSKIWQMERSCMCCQESGEREASVSLFCPKAKNGEKKFRKHTIKSKTLFRPTDGPTIKLQKKRQYIRKILSR
uniref:DAN domain-containing protein n=1 Tax=Anopheles christyi TaxID=43041 RepID=A0A182JUA2_9DIPT